MRTFALLLFAVAFAFVRGDAQNLTKAMPQRSGDDGGFLILHEGQDFGTDTDRDGVADSVEVNMGTNPHARDTDGDGYLDRWEINYGLNPVVQNQGVRLMYVPKFLPVPEGYEGAEVFELTDHWAAGYAWNDGGTSVTRWNLITGEVEVGEAEADLFPYDLSPSGVVVGTVGFEGMVWGPGREVARLGVAPGHTFYARGINMQNRLVGGASSVIAGTGAFAWQFPGDPSDNFVHLVPPPGFTLPVAVSINDHGDIAGSARLGGGTRHAVIWRDGVPTPIPALSGSFEIEKITNAGDLFGRSAGKAFVWQEGKGLTWLTPGDFFGSALVWDVNAGGEVIGEIGGISVIWRPASDDSWTIHEIASEIDDPEIAFGSYYAINDRGQIGGSCVGLFDTQPIILTPVVSPELSVDADHDGIIELGGESADDVTSSSAPFRLWSNDDDDTGDVKRNSRDDVPRPQEDDSRDAANNRIDGVRDLNDFFPVFFNLKQLLAVLPAGLNGVSYHLRHASSALGIVFTHLERSNAFGYLQSSPADLNTGFGLRLAQAAGEAAVNGVTAAGLDLGQIAPEFLERIAAGTGGVALVEARRPTDDPLILEVRSDDRTLIELKLHVHAQPVESMFSYFNLRSHAEGSEISETNRGPFYGETEITPPSDDPFARLEARKNVVFLHGYNVNAESARGWASEIFKRLFWSGSTAQFFAILWRGDDGQGEGLAPASVTPDYHRNVGHAWQQGLHLRDFLTQLSAPTAILAHSLGNMVAAVALTHERDPDNHEKIRAASGPVIVTDYFAIDAAIPMEAFAATEVTEETRSRMRHRSWKNYQERLWPTSWHLLFDPMDSRSRLTWKNVFAELAIGANFYSSGEDVLQDPATDDTPFWEPIVEGGLQAWVAQEKCKGGRGVGATAFRSVNAGWGLNPTWFEESVGINLPLAAFEATELKLPASALAEEPFFLRFQASETNGFYPGYEGSRLMAPFGSAAASDEATRIVTFAKCLAEGIPALSYALGANESVRFGSSGFRGNFDLNVDWVRDRKTGFRNGWPASRKDTNWRHSDLVDVSYVHVFPLFNKITEFLKS